MSDEELDEGQEPEANANNEPAAADEDPRIRKANQEAATYRRELRAAQAELKKLREANQTEAEKAVAEAEERGKKSAMTAAAARLVKAEFRAAGAGRVDKETLDGFLEYVDPLKFVDENGEPNEKAIQAAISRLAPKSDSGSGRPVPDLKSAALPAGETAPSSASDWMRRQVSR